jgi:tRNA pseudouridine55 synthase
MRPVAVTEKQLLGAMTAFLGEIHQVPPMFSALKRDGKPLYEYARAGIELERAARRVTIHGLELRSFTGDEAVIHVDCSKGTYVRTLAADIGQVLGCGAHLSALRRTRIGALDLAGAMTLPDLEAMTSAERDACLLPADALLSRLPQVRLSQQETEMILHGQRIAWSGMAGARFRLYAVDGRFIGLGEVDGDACLQPHRLVATAD